MKILETYPPNYEQIASAFDLTGREPLFTYGDVVFNPHKAKLRPDLLIHEEVHMRQQGNDPEAWWNKYLTDKEFRLSQETDAYAIQYGFVKHLGKTAKEQDWFLERLAEFLSSPMYGDLLTFAQAKTKIRKRQKEISVDNLQSKSVL